MEAEELHSHAFTALVWIVLVGLRDGLVVAILQRVDAHKASSHRSVVIPMPAVKFPGILIAVSDKRPRNYLPMRQVQKRVIIHAI